MFAKLHQQHQPQDHYQFHHPHHHHHQITTLDRQISEEEEEESRSSGGGARSISKKSKHDPDSGGGEEGTIEVTKRPRGRPPGSKNKPKPPLIITRDTECAMRPVFLELPSGLDLIDAIARFTHRRNIGLTVLTATGSVTNVSFRQPSTNNTSGDGTIVTFRGRFEVLSISATFLPPSLPITATSSSSSPSLLPSSFMISLVGPQGQIIGGSVAGSLVTAGTLFIMAASFDNPSYHRLPVIEDDGGVVVLSTTSCDREDNQNHDSVAAGDHPALTHHVSNPMYHHHHHHHVPHTSDLGWTPTTRPPHQSF